MTTEPESRCKTCGTLLRGDEPRGVCPRCLLLVGLAEERANVVHIRCPQCHTAIEVIDEAVVHEVTCPSCDSRFSLLGDPGSTQRSTPIENVGRFELIEHVGMGAFGSVWKARDPQLDRVVALKVPRKEQLTASETELFLREARAAGQLQHPGIVSVHEAGRDGDRIYIVSDFVQGVTLADALTAGKPTVTQAVLWSQAVAEALHHAHEKGVIHRDMKPSNVMLDQHGCPKVMDFGLAKREATEITMTVEGRILGTPAYMSPEQARGDAHHADARSDVYSLGVVLFELLTGDKPFRGNSQMLLNQVLQQDAPSPRSLNGDIHRDLETICLKCMEKSPERRYATAKLLADDLARFLAGQPVLARPYSRIGRCWRWCQRHRAVAALLAAVMLSLLLGFLTTVWQWQLARRNYNAADRSRSLAEMSQRESEEALSQSKSRLAQLFIERGLQKLDFSPHVGLPWLTEALTVESGSSSHATNRLRVGLMLRELPRLDGYWSQARDAAFSRDGSKVAIASGNAAHLHELPSMRLIKSLMHEHPVQQVTFNDDGTRLATVDWSDADHTHCRIWNAANGNAESVWLDLAEPELAMRDIPRVHFTPAGDHFVVSYSGMYNRWHSKFVTKVFDSHTYAQISPTFGHHSDLDYLNGYHQFSPDGLRVLVPRGVAKNFPGVEWIDPEWPESTDRPQQYNLLTGEPVHSPLDCTNDYYNMPRYTPDGQNIVTAQEGLVHVWSATSGELLTKFEYESDSKFPEMAFTIDSGTLFVIDSRKAFSFNLQSGELRNEWEHRSMFIVDPTGRYFAWKDSSGNSLLNCFADDKFEVDLQDFSRVDFAPDGSRFNLWPVEFNEAGVRVTPPAQLLRTDDGLPLAPPWRFGFGYGLDENFSNNGRYWLSKLDESIFLWDLEQRRPLIESFPPARDANIVDVAVSRDRHHLIVLDSAGHLTSWDTESGQRWLAPFQIPPPAADDPESSWLSIKLNAAGDLIALIGKRRHTDAKLKREVQVVQVWDLKSGRPKFARLEFGSLSDSTIDSLLFTQYDSQLAIAELQTRSEDRTPENPNAPVHTQLHRIDARSGVQLHPPLDFEYQFSLVDITADGQRCLVKRDSNYWPAAPIGSDFNPAILQVHVTDSWKPISPQMPTGSTGGSRGARLSPDGTRLVMGGGEIWDTTTGTRLHTAPIDGRVLLESVFAEDGDSFITATNKSGEYSISEAEIRVIDINGKSLGSPMTNTLTQGTHIAIDPHSGILCAAGGRVRLWDAKHGIVLTRAIPIPGANDRDHGETSKTFFSPTGKRVYFATGGQLAVIDLAVIAKETPGDTVLEALSQILSGKRLDPSGGLQAVTDSDLEQAWQIVKSSVLETEQ